MDISTVDAYNRDPAGYAKDWHEQPPAHDLHAALLQYFRPGPTADIGCGSGRDTAWLNGHGFPATGFDASAGLLAEARWLHPGIGFLSATLPELAGISDGSFANVLCETVIMHLPPACIAPAVRRLLDILAPSGTIYLSWRVTQDTDRRDENGRLYAAFDASLITDQLAGTHILLNEEKLSASSGKLIHRIVARRLAAG